MELVKRDFFPSSFNNDSLDGTFGETKETKDQKDLIEHVCEYVVDLLELKMEIAITEKQSVAPKTPKILTIYLFDNTEHPLDCKAYPDQGIFILTKETSGLPKGTHFLPAPYLTLITLPEAKLSIEKFQKRMNSVSKNMDTNYHWMVKSIQSEIEMHSFKRNNTEVLLPLGRKIQLEFLPPLKLFI